MFAKLRACLLAVSILTLGACDGADQLTNPSDNSSDVAAAGPVSFAEYESTFRGGIPFGFSSQPTSAFGSRFNGALRNIWPDYLLKELAAIKSRGGKVVLMLAGNPRHYVDDQGHFDLGKWKARVDRFRGVNFSSYISDGTIVGHFLIDEPNDSDNWNGETIAPSVVEEMARYSKQLWPGMVTIVRVQPGYLGTFSGDFRYLDAAWAQYVARKGDPDDYLRQNVADAQKKGLGLVVGLNISKGSATKSELSAKEVESWGSAMLASTYPCGFISWQYDEAYVERADIAQALSLLSEKARNRPTTSCRGTNGQTAGTTSEPLPTAPAPTSPTTTGITLSASSPVQDGDRYYSVLRWSGAAGSSVDLYRDGVVRTWNPVNDGSARVRVGRTPSVFKICERGSSRCSNGVTVAVK